MNNMDLTVIIKHYPHDGFFDFRWSAEIVQSKITAIGYNEYVIDSDYFFTESGARRWAKRRVKRIRKYGLQPEVQRYSA